MCKSYKGDGAGLMVHLHKLVEFKCFQRTLEESTVPLKNHLF